MNVINALMKQIENLSYSPSVVRMHIKDAVKSGVLDNNGKIIAKGVTVEIDGTCVTITKLV